MRRNSCWALLLGLFACDPDNGTNTGTGAWMPETDGSTSAASATATTGASSTEAGTSEGGAAESPTSDPTSSDPDSTGPGLSTSSAGSGSESGEGPSPAACSADALTLIDLLNDYRAENGLGAIPASSSLCVVGDLHVEDLQTEAPHAVGNCNLHSWSDAGAWSACCYTPDHAAAQCMWDKPRELTDYPGNGYENAAGGGGSLDPAQALELWKGSPGHNAVMLNEGTWANLTWNAVGVGISGGYAVLWFGEETDPAP